MIKLRHFLTMVSWGERLRVYRDGDLELIYNTTTTARLLKTVLETGLADNGDEIEEQILYVIGFYYIGKIMHVFVVDDIAARENMEFYDGYHKSLRDEGKTSDLLKYEGIKNETM